MGLRLDLIVSTQGEGRIGNSDDMASGNRRLLSDALTLPADKFGKRLRATVAAIDSVHEIGSPEPIPVVITRERDDLGAYRKQSGTGKPISIEISRKGDSLELTFAHEVGHFLEGASLPGAEFGARKWAFDEITQDWQSAVRESEPAKFLTKVQQTGEIATINPFGFRTNRPASTKYVLYLLSIEELWARSYAQYVAARSKKETLLKQIQTRRFPSSVFPLQWGDGEFEPIAREFDILFREIGWRP